MRLNLFYLFFCSFLIFALADNSSGQVINTNRPPIGTNVVYIVKVRTVHHYNIIYRYGDTSVKQASSMFAKSFVDDGNIDVVDQAHIETITFTSDLWIIGGLCALICSICFFARS